MQSAARVLWQDSEGTALVEGAILLPLLFVLIFGVMEFSWIVGRQHLIEEGVATAGRYIAQSANPNDELTQQGARLLATTGEFDGGTPRVRGWSAEQIRISYTPIINASDSGGDIGLRGGSILENVTMSTSPVLPSLGFFSVLGV